MPNPRGYEVHYSGAVGNALHDLQKQATRRGQGRAFALAFQRIVRALQKNAHEVGEPLYRLPNLRLQVRTVAVSPLLIDFAVSEDRRLVYIKSGKLLSGRGS